MDSTNAREFFERYRGSVAYVEVEGADGDRRIGSAFHVGDGVFVTARHVMDGGRVVGVGTTEKVYIPLEGDDAAGASTFLRLGSEDVPVHRIAPGPLTIDSGTVSRARR